MEVEQGIVANEIMTASAKQDDAVQRSKQDAHDANEVFYTEGSEELKAARIWIMNYSLPRSSGRVREAKRKQAELQEYIARKESKLKEDEEQRRRAKQKEIQDRARRQAVEKAEMEKKRAEEAAKQKAEQEEARKAALEALVRAHSYVLEPCLALAQEHPRLLPRVRPRPLAGGILPVGDPQKETLDTA